MPERKSRTRGRREHNIVEYFLYLLAGGAVTTLGYSFFLWASF